MLVLARRLGERIKIETRDGPIWIALVSIDRGKVKIGIDAPQEMKIYREEVLPRTDAGSQ